MFGQLYQIHAQRQVIIHTSLMQLIKVSKLNLLQVLSNHSNSMEQQSIQFNPVFLWDDGERIPGYIELHREVIQFHFKNFKQSKLTIQIELKKITEIKLYQLYDLITRGLEIHDSIGRKFIFILDDPLVLRKLIHDRIIPG